MKRSDEAYDLEELASGLLGSPERRIEQLMPVRAQWGENPALGPLLYRVLALDLLEMSGQDEQMAAEMVRAAELEERSGWFLAASHTRHQLALLTSSRGRVQPVVRYYRESLESLRDRGNRRALGLSLRSLGELGLRSGRPSSARSCWEGARDALQGEELPEADGPPSWLELLSLVEAHG